jgi:hypothetical protein
MSNIPSSAMPHAGGTSDTSSDTRASTSGSSSASYGSGTSSASGTYQPDTYRREPSYSDRSQDRGGLMEKARDHKTGIAVGVAIGAIAAAAIPFMFSGKRKSSERDYSAQYDRDVYVDNRGSAMRSGSDWNSGSGTGSSAMAGTTTTGTSGTTGARGSTTTSGTGGSTLGGGSSGGSSGGTF